MPAPQGQNRPGLPYLPAENKLQEPDLLQDRKARVRGHAAHPAQQRSRCSFAIFLPPAGPRRARAMEKRPTCLGLGFPI